MFSFVYKIIIAKKLQITISKVISFPDNWDVKRVIILLKIIIIMIIIMIIIIITLKVITVITITKISLMIIIIIITCI